MGHVLTSISPCLSYNIKTKKENKKRKIKWMKLN